MKFLCGGCKTKYQISDEKIRGKILTIRCKKCGAKILVRESLQRDGGTAVAPIQEEERVAASEARGAVAAVQAGGSATLQSAFDVAMGNEEHDDMPTTIAPTPSNLETAGVEWYSAIDGEQSGPFAFPELVRKLLAKELVGRHYVWHDGMDGWKRIREVGDLQPYLPDNKKKPPPPPPTSGIRDPEVAKGGAGAEVLDFASKRKERQQGKKVTTADLSSNDIEAQSIEKTDSAQAKKDAKSAAAARREGQLDEVLNDKLGASGGASALSAPAAIVDRAGDGKVGIDVAFDKDDIFANVPRASEQDNVARESTRFFVAAAGMNDRKRRAKIATIAGGIAATGFAAFIAAWGLGFIEMSLPGIGNPFSHFGKRAEEDMEIAEINPEDAEALRKILDPEEKKRFYRESRKRKKAGSRGPAGPSGGYIEDEKAAGPEGSRGGEAQALGLGDRFAGGGVGSVQLPSDANLPGTGVENFPAVEQATLSQDTIGKVIHDRKRSVSICYQQSLRGNEELRGKLEFLVTIEPSGSVSRANVETSQFRGTKLATCIASKIKEWRFPPFVGEAQQVAVPFVLEKNSY